MYTAIEIESKRTVLEASRKAAVDAANLALAPLQAKIQHLENESHRIILDVTERASRIDGQLDVLNELAKELDKSLTSSASAADAVAPAN